MATLLLPTPIARRPSRMADSDAAGMAARNACTARWKSRLSYSRSTVSSSGNPSKKVSGPRRVSMRLGMVIRSGTSVPIRGLVVVVLACMGPLGLGLDVGERPLLLEDRLAGSVKPEQSHPGATRWCGDPVRGVDWSRRAKGHVDRSVIRDPQAIVVGVDLDMRRLSDKRRGVAVIDRDGPEL